MPHSFSPARRKLLVSVREVRAGGVVRRAVDYDTAGFDDTKGTVDYTFRGAVLPPPLLSHDFALLAVLFVGMSKGLDIHVRGSVSRTLLANLEEFQYAWCKWYPRAYVKIDVTAEAETESGPTGNGQAVLAYSGGVDANFSLLRHTIVGAGRQRQDIAVAAIINGFDLPSDRPALFDDVVSKAKSTLAEFNLPLTAIDTNWKQTACTDWAMEYFVGIASVLHQFAGTFSAGLVGNCIDYQSMVWPWGSNGITNALLDSGGFRMVTDGAGYTRCEKAEVIARFPSVKDSLRVCWWGPLTGGGADNCGRCEKCLRTKMAFLCHRVDPGRSLPSNHTPADIVLLGLRTKVPMPELAEILTTARRNRIRAPWVLALCLGIPISYLASMMRWVYCPLKREVMRIVHSARTGETAVFRETRDQADPELVMAGAGGKLLDVEVASRSDQVNHRS